MNISEVLATIKVVPTSTRLKAWVFEIDKLYYHVAEYSGHGIPDCSSIWTSSKNGKRTSTQPIFTTQGMDHKKCITKYIESIILNTSN